jgi:hypothetical protein
VVIVRADLAAKAGTLGATGTDGGCGRAATVDAESRDIREMAQMLLSGELYEPPTPEPSDSDRQAVVMKELAAASGWARLAAKGVAEDELAARREAPEESTGARWARFVKVEPAVEDERPGIDYSRFDPTGPGNGGGKGA